MSQEMEEVDLGMFEMTNEAVFVQLRHPKSNVLLEDKEGPVGVVVFGAESAVFKKHQHRLQNETSENMAKRRALISSEQFEKEALTTLADCISEFRNVKYKGEVFEAPKDNFRFLEIFPTFKDQINEAMADRTRFMPALSKS